MLLILSVHPKHSLGFSFSLYILSILLTSHSSSHSQAFFMLLALPFHPQCSLCFCLYYPFSASSHSVYPFPASFIVIVISIHPIIISIHQLCFSFLLTITNSLQSSYPFPAFPISIILSIHPQHPLCF